MSHNRIVILHQYGLIMQAARRTILKDAAKQAWSSRNRVKRDDNSSLNLGDVIGTFIILIVGYGCAALTLALERFHLIKRIAKTLKFLRIHQRINSVQE